MEILFNELKTLGFSVFFYSNLNRIADVEDGIRSARNFIRGSFEVFLFELLVPVALIIIGIYILISLVKLASRRRQGEEIDDHIFRFGILLVIMGLLIGFETIIWTPLIQ